jgi:YVTN family beta-propeller protein
VNRTLLALVAFLVVGSALGQSSEPANFRITTWNLELFPNGSAREAPQEKQAQRIKAAADVLKELNPDILLLQEVQVPGLSLVMSPTRPLMYATIPSRNSVAVINTNTLAVENTVFVGSHPVNLAFSPTDSKACIANSTSNIISGVAGKSIRSALIVASQADYSKLRLL